ncbi:hypothetical protein [Halopiger goleimassiliensis]|nr:hypothetical protein [Halopiger goleimassiliensis]
MVADLQSRQIRAVQYQSSSLRREERLDDRLSILLDDVRIDV